MTSFFDEIRRNQLKSILLMLIFGALFTVIIYLLILLLGGSVFAFAIAGIIVIAYAAFSYQYGSKIVLKASGAKKADKDQYPVLYDIVEEMALATQVKMPDVYIINDQNPNAFATGKNKNHASVAVTTGLLQMMNKNELEGVISHEMSHIADNDIQFMLLVVVFAGVIGIVAAFIRMFAFLGAIGGGERQGGGIILLIALVISILAPLVAMLIRLAISRKREYMADANGARITRAPMYLASALKKIQGYENKPNAPAVKNTNEVTAMLYFANPLSKKSIMNLFSTHPPIEDRIAGIL